MKSVYSLIDPTAYETQQLVGSAATNNRSSCHMFLMRSTGLIEWNFLLHGLSWQQLEQLLLITGAPMLS